MRCVALLLAVLASVRAPMQAQDDLSQYITPENVPVRVLDATESFNGLTDREKLYAHWMSQASWTGALICFEQVSAESPSILEMLLRIYSKSPVGLKKAVSRHGVTDQELDWLRQYTARFLSNTGNYLSFGDTKFVPRIPLERLEVIVNAAAALDTDQRLMDLWWSVRSKMYSLAKDERALGLGDKGTSNYYGETVTQKDIETAKDAMKVMGIEAWNTRLFHLDPEKTDGRLELRVASVRERKLGITGEVVMVHGDYSEILREVVRAFKMAYHYCANDHQRTMVQRYIDHFERGDISLHKDAMRAWVKDVGPVVETNIGFIETYRDPVHVRAEWEGFVAIVNKEQSAKFGGLVDKAGSFIPKLPWPAPFEKDAYRRPDFTSLEVLAFANSGIPAGINIPNYDEIRMNEGFKNVSLGNVLRKGSASKERVTFVPDADQELYKQHKSEAFEVQVGLHELLGHGCGKLFMQKEDGEFNFDRGTKNPVTERPVATWYKPGETWGSVFGRIASSFEECRAEAVGLYLCTDEEILRIFGHDGSDGADIAYVNWLLMARAGLAALPFHNPETKKWGQAHMQGRYALLQVMLRAGDGLCRLEKRSDGHWVVHVDRSRIETVGRKAVGEFLKKLNVYKSTADVAAGNALYADYTSVDGKMLQIRDYAIKERKARHIWVQPVTDVDATGKVILREYPGTYQGIIDSFLDRYAFLVE